MIDKVRELSHDDRAVSKPVGVVLLIAIVVVLVALLAAFLFGASDVAQPAPNTQIDFETVPNAADDDPSLIVSHDGGEIIQSSNTGDVNIIVVDRGYLPWAGTQSDSQSGYVNLNDGSISTGDEIDTTINDSSSTVSPGDEILVTWTSPSGGNSAILAEYTVPSTISSAYAQTVVSCTVDGSPETLIYDGEGTESDPFKVTNMTELQCMEGDLDAHYELTEDIDASSTATWNGGAGFEPIGNPTTPFAGSFNGNGHDIKSLTVNRPGENYVGLFGLSVTRIENVNMESVDMTGDAASGGFVGRTQGSVDAVTVSGSVSGSQHVGGVVGLLENHISASTSSATVTGSAKIGGLAGTAAVGTAVQNSHSTGLVTASSQEAGGLVGALNGDVVNSYSTATVDSSGAVHVGGLVGSTFHPQNDNPEILNSYATGDVTGHINAGGLVGDSTADVIKQSYATGDVTADDTVGGAIGSTAAADAPDHDGVQHTDVYATGEVSGSINVGGYIGVLGDKNPDEVTHVFATGPVSGDDYVGGLVGRDADPSNNTVTESYWDTETSGQSSSEGGTGLTESEMTGSDAESNMVGFDFTDVWRSVASDYPEFQWE